MTDKDIRRLEKAMERVVREVLDINYDRDDETTIPMSIIDEIEAYMGEPITFMGIS